MADAFARVIFTHLVADTRVIWETRSPTWDQMLVFRDLILWGDVNEIAVNPPTIVVEVFDKDIGVSFFNLSFCASWSCLSIYLSVCISVSFLSVSLSDSQSVCLIVYLSVCRPVCLSVCIFCLCRPVRLSTCQSVIRLSVNQSFTQPSNFLSR